MKKSHKILTGVMLALGLFFASCSSGITLDVQNSTEKESRAAAAGWATSVYYNVGDVVAYNGKLYQCRIAHSAIDGWYPDIVPALWLEIGIADSNSTDSGNNEPTQPSQPVEQPNTGSSAETSVSVTGLPRHILTGYWQNFNNGAKVLRISEVPTVYNLIVVSFADATFNPGEITFNLDTSLGFSEAQFIQDIKTVQARGQHVILSVGGETGNVIIASDADANRFASSATYLMNKYGFEGIDIDLEHGINSTYVAKALRGLPSGSIITFAPQTLDMQSTGYEYFKLALAVKDILTVNNTQYYNSGTMLGYDGKVYAQGGEDFLTALATIQLENGLRPDQVGLGLPASTRGAGSGYVDPQIVVNALDTLAYGTKHGNYMPPNKYPTIRGAMTWSINWDASNNWNFSNIVGAKLKAMNEAAGENVETPSVETPVITNPSTEPVLFDNGLVSGATYKILAKCSGKSLDVADWSTSPSTNVHQWEYYNQANQHWILTQTSDGYWTIVSEWNGFSLDCEGWGTNSGTNVLQWYNNAQDNQKWAITPMGNGYYKVINKYSSLALDVNAASADNGANVQTWEWNGTDAQLWSFTRIDDSSNSTQGDNQTGSDNNTPVVVTPGNTGTVNTSLPKRIMSGYWHTWDGGCPYIRLADVDSSWDVINVSFAEPVTPGSGNGQMKFGVAGSLSDFKADVKTLQARGKKVVLSIGGYEGYFYLQDANAVNTFVNCITGFINEYGFDGIDIDLEQSSVAMNSGNDPDFANPTTPRIVNMINAIRRICDNYGDDFILSWAPETFYAQMGHTYYGGLNGYVDSRCGAYLPMIHALRDKTTYVQVQLYNSGAIKGNDGAYYSMGDEGSLVEMCKMMIEGFYLNGGTTYFWPGLRADQVVIAVPCSQGAAGSGQVSNATLQNAFRRLEAAYPGMRGIMTWSINWDSLQNGNSFGRENRAFLNNY